MGYIVNILYFVLFYKIVNSKKELLNMLWLFCISTGVYSLIALLKGVSGSGRLEYGQMYDPNDLALYALSFLPLNFLFLSKSNPFWKRITSCGIIAVSLMVVLMSGSRGGFLALCLVVTMLLLSRSQLIKYSYKVTIVALVLIVITYGGSAFNFTRFLSMTQIGGDYNVSDETGRLEIWKKGFGLMLNNPFTGVGISCFAEAIGRERAMRGLQEVWQSPHNSLIQIGVEAGIIGMILYLLISYKAFRIFGRDKNINKAESMNQIGKTIQIGFAGYLVGAMFLSQAYSLIWVIYIVLSASLCNFHNSKTIKQ
jgi:O-antigen ligase